MGSKKYLGTYENSLKILEIFRNRTWAVPNRSVVRLLLVVGELALSSSKPSTHGRSTRLVGKNRRGIALANDEIQEKLESYP